MCVCQHPNKKIIAIIGQTASGKSDLALQIAKKIKGFVLSCDSRQIFSGAQIGTNQLRGQEVSGHEMKAMIVEEIPHYFIGFLEPNERYSVAQFQTQALKLIEKEHRAPVLVGGTGFYLSAIIDGWDMTIGKPDLSLRKRLNRLSLAELSKQLSSLDTNSQKIIATKNRRRLERAIEATLTSGIPFSRQKKQRPERFNVLQIGIRRSPSELEQRINVRVDTMLTLGLLNEVRDLQHRYGDFVLDRLGIGYRELGNALLHKISVEEAVALIKLHTRQYAKRQMTWFKRDSRIHWVERFDEAFDLVAKFY